MVKLAFMGNNKTRMFRYITLTALSFVVCLLPTIATASSRSLQDDCLLTALNEVAPLTTAKSIRDGCIDQLAVPADQVKDTDSSSVVNENTKNSASNVIERRINAEAKILEQPFVLTAHRPNYVAPFTYNNHPNDASFKLINPDQPIDSEEIQFQISFKFPIAQRLAGGPNDLFVAFTSRAWWQAYNSNISRPFRETDYEPELFLRHYGGPTLGPLKVSGWDLGVVHQSNGQSDPLSRSWNRFQANLAIDTGSVAAIIRSWFRFPESAQTDNNPQLHRYLGYGDIRFIHGRNERVLTAMFRPGTSKGAVELTWSMPLWQQLRLYVIYFNGYGESLLDYDFRSDRLSIGVGLNDYIATRYADK